MDTQSYKCLDKNTSQSNVCYHNQVQKLLDDILEKSLVMVNNKVDDGDNNNIHGGDIHVPESDLVASNGGGIRLFKHSTPGLSLDLEGT